MVEWRRVPYVPTLEEKREMDVDVIFGLSLRHGM
jgi:hypothetical protein